MALHRGPFDEGKASGLLGSPENLNPYARAIQARGGSLPPVFREYANDWASGWVYGDALRKMVDRTARRDPT